MYFLRPLNYIASGKSGSLLSESPKGVLKTKICPRRLDTHLSSVRGGERSEGIIGMVVQPVNRIHAQILPSTLVPYRGE